MHHLFGVRRVIMKKNSEKKVYTNHGNEITGDRQHLLFHQISKFHKPTPIRFMKMCVGKLVTSLHRINDKECGYGKTS